MSIRNKLVALASMLAPLATFASGSVVGNGGDPIFHFLEATRFAYVQTIALAVKDSAEASTFCTPAQLSPAQSRFCREFFFAIADGATALNTGTAKTVFVLRENPLLVTGPDGKPMPVSARTPLGSAGEIEFHRDSLRMMSPSQVLFLIAHEFGHKVAFNGGFTDDNSAIGPFSSGRELIDSMADAIVDVAKRRGKIGTQYGLRDTFDCRSSVQGAVVGTRASTPRLFLSPDLMSYETSISRNPTDTVIYVPETGTTDLMFRFVISEPANCGELPSPVAARKTVLSILRLTKTENGDLEDLLTEKEIPGWNPMCDSQATSFGLGYRNVNFSCAFRGTEGVTNSLLGFENSGKF